MNHWKLLAPAMLALALAACGAEEPDRTGGEDAERTEATTGETGREGPWEETPSEPGEIMDEPTEESRELWATIQEEQSELTGEQQRTLQACAEIKLREADITMKASVQECREEMEEMAEEQENEEEDGNGEEG